MAYDILKEYLQPFEESVQILELPLSIAAFMTPEFILQHLKMIDLTAFQSIIVPGFMQGSTQLIEDTLKIPTYKGPRYASDIPIIFQKSIQLSKTIPADKLILTKGIEEYKDILANLYQSFPPHPFFPLSTYRIGIDYPPLILAEIVDAPKLSISKILSMGKYFINNGAQMLDIGAIVGQNNAQKLKIIIEEVKSTLGVPVSIDSMDPEEIEVAIEAGADLILSLDAGNIHELKNIPKDRAITIIPTNIHEGIFPKTPEARVKLLNQTLLDAKRLGFKKILADPLLESPISPGLTKSLETFIQCRKGNPDLPFLFGAGNVSEIIDADSIGINGLLACIAVELGVSVILTTEYSNKTRKSIDELSYGVRLAFLADYKKRPPVSLPFHLLRAKNKKRYDYTFKDLPPSPISVTDLDESFIPDPNGYFKIWIDHEMQLIHILHYTNSHDCQLIQGNSAEALGKKILSEIHLQDPTHILYLGRELERAEIALFLGKDYVQDVKFAEVV